MSRHRVYIGGQGPALIDDARTYSDGETQKALYAVSEESEGATRAEGIMLRYNLADGTYKTIEIHDAVIQMYVRDAADASLRNMVITPTYIQFVNKVSGVNDFVVSLPDTGNSVFRVGNMPTSNPGALDPKRFWLDNGIMRLSQTKGAPVHAGVTGDRPTGVDTGYTYFDTTIGKPVWYNGASWVDATGAVV